MRDSGTKAASELRRSVAKALAVLAACLLLAVAGWLFDRIDLRVAWTAYFFSYGFFANALPIVLIFLLLMALCNRLSIAGMSTMLLVVGLYYADHQKFKFLSQPVSFNDIFFVRQLDASTLHLLWNYLNIAYVLAAVLIVAGLAGACVWLEPVFFRRKSPFRPLIGLAAAALCTCLVVGGPLASAIYSPSRLRVVPWAPLRTILHGGLLGSIEYSNLDKGRALDVPIDRAAIKAFADMPSGAVENDGGTPRIASMPTTRPDIVIIQSESFFDPAILKDIDTSDKLLPNLHRALKQAVGGTMKAPTFGGGTLRTEFEVLTGIPMDAYPNISFPYLQINQESIPSLVGVLRGDGYATYAVHGNAGSFWDRDKAFREMGFDRFFTKADFPAHAKTDGWFLSDEAMTNEIISVLDKSAAPTLIFAVSIEGHGPYEQVPVNDATKRDAIEAPASWPAAAVAEYKNYMYHIRNADQQMGRLWAYLASRHRPYVLVFYGDHLPALQKVYAEDGFDDKLDGTAQYVPWFVLSSDRTAAQEKHIDAWMLGAEVLSAAGLPEPPYYRALAKAERLLGGSAGAAQRSTVQKGVDSMSRLYLRGTFDQAMSALAKPGSTP